jgi:hypothetical protein
MLSEREFNQLLRDQFAGLTHEQKLELLHGAIRDIKAAKAACAQYQDNEVQYFAQIFQQLEAQADAAVRPLRHTDEQQISG